MDNSEKHTPISETEQGMSRDLCEWYRDQGYPQDKHRGAKWCYWPCSPGLGWQQQEYTDAGALDFVTIPDIPGLLAFLRDKLCGPDSTVMSRLKFEELVKHWANRIIDIALSMEELGDVTAMLAEDGKAAILAMEGRDEQ